MLKYFCYIKMKRSLAALALFLFISSFSFAQQEPQYSQYMFNVMQYNPGYAGSRNAICAIGQYRQQWVGFKDMDGNKVAPETYNISLSAPLRVLHGGVSLVIQSDKLGYEESIQVKLGYAYQINLGMGKLGLGLMATLSDQRMDFSKLNPIDDDPLISQLADESAMIFDLDFGAYYQIPEQFYVGLSTTRLLESTSKTLSETESATLKLQHKRHYYITAGYQYALPGNSAFEIDPSVLLKTDLAGTQIDVSAILKYNDKFWGGVSYRLQDAVVVILGMEYKNFHIGYSYDVTTSSIGGSSSGTHEVMAGYCFKLEVEKLRESYKNTRFL